MNTKRAKPGKFNNPAAKAGYLAIRA